MMLNSNSISKLKSINISALEVEKLNADYSKSRIFNFFQLRPKDKKGIELVSFLPQYPMRGINLTFKNSREVLNTIADRLDKLDGMPLKEYNLDDMKFPKRQKTTKTYREDDVQAAFCLQQLKLGAQFDGIKLVTTEFLMVAENKRIDILGIKDMTLYVFELKKDRENGAYSQASRYKNELEQNLSEYLRLLRQYPNINKNMTEDNTNVQAVVVMPWAKNCHLAKPLDVAHWLYEIPSDYDFSRELIFNKME